MSPVRTRVQTVSVGGTAYRIRAIADLTQHDDPAGVAAARGIPPATWAHFGHVWPAGVILAELMVDWPLAGARVLELGCGLALASLVLQRRGAAVSACDRHPGTAGLLAGNLRRNGLPPLPFHEVDWNDPHAALGTFDLLIGSDLLYDGVDPENLAGFIGRHASPAATVVVVDLGRARLERFSAALRAEGFVGTEQFAERAPRMRVGQYRRA